MEVLKSERILCPCCMVEHDVKTVRMMEGNIFKNKPVEYMVECEPSPPATQRACERMVLLSAGGLMHLYRYGSPAEWHT